MLLAVWQHYFARLGVTPHLKVHVPVSVSTSLSFSVAVVPVVVTAVAAVVVAIVNITQSQACKPWVAIRCCRCLLPLAYESLQQPPNFLCPALRVMSGIGRQERKQLC